MIGDKNRRLRRKIADFLVLQLPEKEAKVLEWRQVRCYSFTIIDRACGAMFISLLKEMQQHTAYNYGQIIKRTLSCLADNDVIRMAGATAFFTTFALPPMLMIVVRTLGVFSDRRTVGRAMMLQLRKILGDDSAAAMLQTIRSFRALEHNYLVAVGLGLFLVFVATSLFAGIRNSINQLWHIRVSKGVRMVDVLKARGMAVLVILAGGLLFLGFQLFDAQQHLIARGLPGSKDGLGSVIGTLGHVLGGMLVSALWFYLLFTLLPDGRPNRRVVVTGALVTGVLLMLGKALLGVLLQPVRVSSFYGVSGAIALILLFMFYSSIFLYFGAALVRVLSDARGTPVVPKKHAERYRIETD
jgi:membrane protein